jgi:hypothetical protein
LNVFKKIFVFTIHYERNKIKNQKGVLLVQWS